MNNPTADLLSRTLAEHQYLSKEVFTLRVQMQKMSAAITELECRNKSLADERDQLRQSVVRLAT